LRAISLPFVYYEVPLKIALRDDAVPYVQCFWVSESEEERVIELVEKISMMRLLREIV
jgi:hypothetical protein